MSFSGKNNAKITNKPSGGGNKLQGIASTTTKGVASIREIQNKSWGMNRNVIFYINQLGGIGPYNSQFNQNSDGVQVQSTESEVQVQSTESEVNEPANYIRYKYHYDISWNTRFNPFTDEYQIAPGEYFHGVNVTVSNKRVIYITIPNKTKPSNGWPYLLYFQFMNAAGEINQYGQQVEGLFGATEGDVPTDTPGGILKPDVPPANQSPVLNNIMKIMNTTLENGIAIISFGMFADDSYFYCEDAWLTNRGGDDGKQRMIDNLCFNDGNNPDFLILNQLFKDIKEGKHTLNGVRGSDSHLGDLDYNNMGIWGFSVGAQMASRCMQSFPTTRTYGMDGPSGELFPNIKFAVMCAGGSYGCYDYSGALASTGSGGTPPFNAEPCSLPIPNGCCPFNFTEKYYGTISYEYYDGDTGITHTFAPEDGSGNWAEHPVVLLLQTESDEWADSNASINYYEILKEKNVRVNRNIFDEESIAKSATIDGHTHGPVDQQVTPARKFINYWINKPHQGV